VQLLRISREQIDAIKRRVRVESLAADWGLELERRGRHLFALCPFHDERTPSFVITPERGLFHCFGCGAAGDVIGFAVRFQHMTFPEALRMLALRAGLQVHDVSSSRREDTCGRTSWR
jgi:DNA primase